MPKHNWRNNKKCVDIHYHYYMQIVAKVVVMTKEYSIKSLVLLTVRQIRMGKHFKARSIFFNVWLLNIMIAVHLFFKCDNLFIAIIDYVKETGFVLKKITAFTSLSFFELHH